MNRLEELGRVDAEKAFTKKGARNLREEKKRIVGELKKADGGKVKKKKSRKNPMKDERAREGMKSQYRKMGFGKLIDDGTIDFSEYKRGGRALKKVQPHQKGLKKLPTKVRNKMGYMKKGGRVGMGKAMRGGGCVR
jgi:Skp family chaperone for outer membrane proteins